MKKNILSFVILILIIFVTMGGFVKAAVTDDSGCVGISGACIDTTQEKCSGTTRSGLCTGPSTRVCCVGGHSAINNSAAVKSSSSGSGSVEIPNPLKTNSIAELIDRIITYVITIATVIFPLIIIYGAFQFLTAGGDMEKVTTARKTLQYAVIGYMLILISKGITMIIADLLGAK